MMILASEAEILSLIGPIVYPEDPEAEIDPAISDLSPEEAAAFAEGQVTAMLQGLIEHLDGISSGKNKCD